MTITKKIKVSLLTSVIILFAANIVIGLFMVSGSSKFSSLEKEKQEILQVNQNFRDSLIRNSSLTLLSEKADASGYEKAEDKVYITGTETVMAAAN